MTSQEFINSIPHQLVEHTRNQLANKHPEAHIANYAGLGNEAAQIIANECRRLQQSGITITVVPIHGTLAHTPAIDSKYWITEHTIVKLIAYDDTVYIDATCGQFNCIIDGINDFYIGVDLPKWFYPDARNPALKKRGFLGLLNKITITLHRKDEATSYSLIEFCQHVIWGKISKWKLVQKIWNKTT